MSQHTLRSHRLNPRITGMRCLKCGKTYPVGDYFYGCPRCLAQGANAALTFCYDGTGQIDAQARGFARYAQFLPYGDAVTLGEGGTPLVPLAALAEELGVDRLYGKNEFQNPTGSHKDRMNPFITARAVEAGYPAVTCASSGNEAASLAAYAAAEGLRCVNVSTEHIPKLWKDASDAAGAELVLVPDSGARLSYQRAHMGEGWYPATNLLDVPVSSSPYGIQGYKTLSFEVYEAMGRELPDYILIPTCRGDLLYGVFEGFFDLRRAGYIDHLPKLVACEPLPRLELVLEQGRSHTEKFPGRSDKTASIGGVTATYQSEYALRESGGFAVSVPQEEAVAAVKKMARHGLYLESSSAIVHPCLQKALGEGRISPRSSVLLVLTSSGYKNSGI